MTAPLVSVIIPTFNRAHVLGHALDSVLAQTLGDFEVIVVDDASTDNTRELMAGISDERVLYTRRDHSVNAGVARNTGMQQARGKYIAFLDSDDRWLPRKLELQTRQLEELGEDWGCSYTGALIFKQGGATGKDVYEPRLSGSVLGEFLQQRLGIWTPTFMFRRALLDEVGGFDPELKRVEDIDFYIRILQRTKLACLSEPLVELYLVLDKGIADTALECDRALLGKHAKLIDAQGAAASRYIHAYYDFRQAERFIAEDRLTEAREYFWRAVRRYPLLPVKRYASFVFKYMRTALKR